MEMNENGAGAAGASATSTDADAEATPVPSVLVVSDTKPKERKSHLPTHRIWDIGMADNHAAMQFRNNLMREYKGDPFTINPRVWWMPWWDVVMAVATLFTATVTPYEVGFLPDAVCDTPLFVTNRIVDVFFMLDIAILFRLQYVERDSGITITSRKQIAINYIKGFFAIDLLAVLPYYLIPLLSPDQHCYPFQDSDDGGKKGNAGTRMANGARTIRLLRLLKLARMFKAARLFQKFVTDAALSVLSITFASMEVVKLIVVILFMSHFQACLWGFIASATSDQPTGTWATAFTSKEVDNGKEEVKPIDLYAAALYWSVMTLTSIGYGDIAPQNPAEQVFCCALMLISSAVWAYVIGTIAGICATLNPNLVQYRNTMDNLNYFMKERKLPREIRLTLREYFTNAREVRVRGDLPPAPPTAPCPRHRGPAPPLAPGPERAADAARVRTWRAAARARRCTRRRTTATCSPR